LVGHFPDPAGSSVEVGPDGRDHEQGRGGHHRQLDQPGPDDRLHASQEGVQGDGGAHGNENHPDRHVRTPTETQDLQRQAEQAGQPQQLPENVGAADDGLGGGVVAELEVLVDRFEPQAAAERHDAAEQQRHRRPNQRRHRQQLQPDPIGLIGNPAAVDRREAGQGQAGSQRPPPHGTPGQQERLGAVLPPGGPEADGQHGRKAEGKHRVVDHRKAEQHAEGPSWGVGLGGNPDCHAASRPTGSG